MARVTVEDCIEVINNRFKLVLMASQRARDIGAGQTPFVDRDNDKNTVISLREIADRLVDMGELEAHIARGVNRRTEATDEDDILATIQSEGWLNSDQVGEITDSAGASIKEIEYEATQTEVVEATEDGLDEEDVSLEDLDDDAIKAAAEALAGLGEGVDLALDEASSDDDPEKVSS